MLALGPASALARRPVSAGRPTPPRERHRLSNPDCAVRRSEGTAPLFGMAAPSTKSGAVLLEFSRSRMRDSGWDQLPPDVRFAGGTLRTENSTLDHRPPNQLLTEIPSCEAGYMTAPERFADRQIPLAPRAPSIHDPLRSCRVTLQRPGRSTADSTSKRIELKIFAQSLHHRALKVAVVL
jgi:hypothetical protein